MIDFYQVSHDSHHHPEFPWIQSIVWGLTNDPECPVCGTVVQQPSSRMGVRLDEREFREWPDVIGCGAHPLFVVSARALDAIEAAGVSVVIGGEVELAGGSSQPGVTGASPPNYVWLNGERMRGASFDFQASGYIGVEFCEFCGTRSYDIPKTYSNQLTRDWPCAIFEDTWSGAGLFTTDLSAYAFFCTDVLVNAARESRLTNFEFVPVEEGERGDAVDYLN